MTTFSPKLLFSKRQGRQIPVWEVCEDGKRVFFERRHKDGMIPVGCKDVYRMGDTTVVVCDTVKNLGNKAPQILGHNDGYYAPNSWYEQDPYRNSAKHDDDDVDVRPQDLQVAEEDLADLVDVDA